MAQELTVKNWIDLDGITQTRIIIIHQKIFNSRDLVKIRMVFDLGNPKIAFHDAIPRGWIHETSVDKMKQLINQHLVVKR